MLKKCLVVSVICLLMLVYIPTIMSTNESSIHARIDDEPDAEIFIGHDIPIGYDKPWPYLQGIKVQIKDIREEPLEPLHYYIRLKTSIMWSGILLLLDRGEFPWKIDWTWEDTMIPPEKYFGVGISKFVGFFAFSVYATAGNVEVTRIGIAILGRILFLT